MNPIPYPRDLRGYGRHPPHPQWPGGARVAVQFVLNVEEGAESCVLDGDAGSEVFLSEIIGATSYPDRHLSMESIYEYGSRVGAWRILREFERRGLPLTVFGVAQALERNPELTAACVQAGHEIACHGWRWLHYQHIDEATEREHLERAVAVHTAVTGSPPLGWYTGRDSPNTRRLVVEHGGFAYDSDYYGDELPFWTRVTLADGRRLPHLVVPYTLDANDMRFATAQGFHCASQFHEYLRDSFDVLHAEGEHAPKMMSVGMHARLLGRPGRFAALTRFLDHLAAHEGVWICRRIDIARHWQARFPAPSPGWTLDGLNRADARIFVDSLGGIFEHSPWVASGVVDQRPFASLDALHQAMCAVVDGAGEERQLALIRAHPQLAGKAAIAGELTASSSREQQGAGLDRCSAEEYARLHALNAAYEQRFGFPFILAVRGHDRYSILAELDRRLHQPADREFAEALQQIARIARFRLQDLLAESR